MVAKDPDDDSDTRRLFIPMKNNLGPPQSGLAFRVEQRLLPNTTIPASSIVWESERVTKTADEIMAANDGSSELRSSRDEAAEWLRADLLMARWTRKKCVRNLRRLG